MNLPEEEAAGLLIIVIIAVVSYKLGYRRSRNDLFHAIAFTQQHTQE